MSEQYQIDKIKEMVEEFFDKMTITTSDIKISSFFMEEGFQDARNLVAGQEEHPRDIINLDIEINEPQILIGQQGQTLFEIQRLLRAVLNKKLQKFFYLNLDINDYKKKKIEYLKELAKSMANQVSLTKERKVLSPMSSYERRIIHSELSQRTDIATESQGDGFDRHIIINPR
jgi:spoIIIJ-associated protein